MITINIFLPAWSEMTIDKQVLEGTYIDIGLTLLKNSNNITSILHEFFRVFFFGGGKK